MEVKLISFTPNAERICAISAALTHSNASPDEIEKMDDKTLKNILLHVLERGHLSVVEHVSFTFAISGVSRVLTHQLVRHRIASYSQQSQRFVRLEEARYVTPPSISRDDNIRKRFEDFMRKAWKEYKALLDAGIPEEDARYVLPNAAKTNIIVTMNARSLLNFFELRCCLKAQWEIRKLANMMLKEVKKIAPTIFKNAGPQCKTRGICPEKDRECPFYPGD